MKKKMFVLLFFTATFATTFDLRCLHYNKTHRDELLGCFSQLVDTNHDNVLNATEVNAFNNACCSSWNENMMSPNDYFQMTCDLNHDNLLDIQDWNHRHACCKDESCIMQVCSFCYNNGWTGPPTK
jgi:hypothetical protein